MDRSFGLRINTNTGAVKHVPLGYNEPETQSLAEPHVTFYILTF